MLTTIAFSITQLYPIFLGALWSRFSPVVWLQETGNRDMKGSRNENREGRALPRIWFLSSKEEISVETVRKEGVERRRWRAGRAETDSSIFPTLFSSRKDRDRDRFLVAFDVHFSNDRVSFRLYMDFLNRGNRGLFFFFSHHVDWNLIEFRFINVWEIRVEYISEISDSDIFERRSRDIEDRIRFIWSRLWEGNQISELKRTRNSLYLVNKMKQSVCFSLRYFYQIRIYNREKTSRIIL